MKKQYLLLVALLIGLTACGAVNTQPQNTEPAVDKEDSSKTREYKGEPYTYEKYDNSSFVADESAVYEEVRDYFDIDYEGRVEGIQPNVIGYYIEDGKNIVILAENEYENAKEAFLKTIKNADNLYFAKSYYTYEELEQTQKDISEYTNEKFNGDKIYTTCMSYEEVGLGEESSILCISVYTGDNEYVNELCEKYGNMIYAVNEELVIEVD